MSEHLLRGLQLNISKKAKNSTTPGRFGRRYRNKSKWRCEMSEHLARCLQFNISKKAKISTTPGRFGRRYRNKSKWGCEVYTLQFQPLYLCPILNILKSCCFYLRAFCFIQVGMNRFLVNLFCHISVVI